jgi:hypothetical protein
VTFQKTASFKCSCLCGACITFGEVKSLGFLECTDPDDVSTLEREPIPASDETGAMRQLAILLIFKTGFRCH